MKIDRNYQIEKAASKDELRPALTHILLEKNFAIATTGQILAKVPIENNSLAGLLDPKALTLARKMQKTPDLELHLQNGTIGIVAMDKHGTHSTEAIEMKRCRFEERDDNYPDWKSVVPKHVNSHKFGFKLKNLIALAAAIGTDEVVFDVDVDDYKKAIIVRPFDCENKAAGLLMPMHIKHHMSDKEIEAHETRQIEAHKRWLKETETNNNQKENYDTSGDETAREAADEAVE